MSKIDRILALIQEAAERFDVFQCRGPGHGNRATNAAMAHLNDRVTAECGVDVVEPILGAGIRQSVDFYVRDEATIVEVEFSLSNPRPSSREMQDIQFGRWSWWATLAARGVCLPQPLGRSSRGCGARTISKSRSSS